MGACTTHHNWGDVRELVVEEATLVNAAGLERNLRAAAPHPKAHRVHVYRVRLVYRRSLAIVVRVRFDKRLGGLFVMEDRDLDVDPAAPPLANTRRQCSAQQKARDVFRTMPAQYAHSTISIPKAWVRVDGLVRDKQRLGVLAVRLEARIRAVGTSAVVTNNLHARVVVHRMDIKHIPEPREVGHRHDVLAFLEHIHDLTPPEGHVSVSLNTHIPPSSRLCCTRAKTNLVLILRSMSISSETSCPYGRPGVPANRSGRVGASLAKPSTDMMYTQFLKACIRTTMHTFNHVCAILGTP